MISVFNMFPIITVKCKIRYWNSFDNICLEVVFNKDFSENEKP